MNKKTGKERLRQEWRKKRDEIPADNRKDMSERIAENLLRHPLQDVERVFLYLSFRSEPETGRLLAELLRRGTRVAVPFCNPETHTMQAVEITGLDQLEEGPYGTLEPGIDLIENGDLKIWSKEEIQVILVPGLVFDRSGFRLGYGGGYYDRYLSGFSGISIGLAFSACVVPDLGLAPPDVPVTMIVTEEGMVSCKDE